MIRAHGTPPAAAGMLLGMAATYAGFWSRGPLRRPQGRNEELKEKHALSVALRGQQF